jgi:hypothetical protein
MAADIGWLWVFGAIAAAVWGPHGAAVPASINRPIVVAELFTSEACSSCPPADMLLSRLVHQPLPDVEVLTVAEHVDYWDHLGWHDRFSSAEFSARQTIYDTNAFHRNEVYTPQLVIDGRFARVGSDADGIRRDIQKAAEAEKASVTVGLEPAGDRRIGVDMRVQWPDARAFKGAIDAIVAATEDNLVTHVSTGENHGRVLRHDAVARWMRSVPVLRAGERVWQGRIEVPIAADWNPANVNVVCFLQERESRRIVGAGVARLSR